MKLQGIYRYPVKGFAGEQLISVFLTAGEGLPDDRRYAITNGSADAAGGDWQTCRTFFINAVNDGLLRFANESDDGTIILASPNGARLSWEKGNAEGLTFANAKMAEFIAPLLPAHDLPVPQICERTQTPGDLSGYWDFTDSAISIVNPVSWEALANAMGKPLDTRRLRGNLYLADLAAWEEFNLLGRRIRIGHEGPELEILRPVKRCPATMVNPQTGERDLAVPPALADHFGHGFCGMYARVVKSGTITAGDQLEVIGGAETPLETASNPDDTPHALWPKPVEVTAAEIIPSAQDGGYARRVSISSACPWPLPETSPDQRFRFHLDTDLIGVATVHEQRDHTTVLHVEPSKTSDPATAHLMEKVQPGDRLIASGPFGRS